MRWPPPRSTLFPYTTLFRSKIAAQNRFSKSRQNHLPKADGGDRLEFNFFLRCRAAGRIIDRKSTRLNSSHRCISYAVFCLKKKKNKNTEIQISYYKTN